MSSDRFIRVPHLLCLLVASIFVYAPARQVHARQAPAGAEQHAAATASVVTAGEKGKTGTPGPAAKAAVKPRAGSECGLCRWFELQTATLSTRYRFVENSRGVTTNNQLQHQESFKARFKFDAKGRYALNASVSSGNSFTGSWNNTGAGTGRAFTNLYLKQLYFSAKPANGFEVQYGGLHVSRGESTEITSYDNDAYLTGQRLIVKRPRELFFDEVSVTYAHLGDLSQPSVTKRLRRLGESNYHQFLVSKKFGKRATISADYTFEAGAETVREAVRVGVNELRVIDTLRLEAYQRADVRPDAGFAVTGEKALLKRLTLGGGFARIDRDYGSLNGDRYGRGKRLFVSAGYALSAEFSVSVFMTRGVGNDFAVGNRTRADLIFSYNLLKTLQRKNLF